MAVSYRPLAGPRMSERDRTIVKALRLYYERDLTQSDVARRLHCSRPKVSKLLAEGRARGLVRIEIAWAGGEHGELELELEERFDLREAAVVETEPTALGTEQAVGAAASALLGGQSTLSTVIGVSWGRALRGLASAMPVHGVPCARIVTLVGATGTARADLHSNHIGATVAAKLGVPHLELAAPALAPSARAREELAATPGLREVLDAGAACDIAAVGIGGVLPESTLVEAGYFSAADLLALGARGAAGDVNWHFVDAAGDACLPEFSARVVGITLEQLRAIPSVVGVAYGAAKAAGVAAGLASGVVSSLVCDADLGRALLAATAPGPAPRVRGAARAARGQDGA